MNREEKKQLTRTKVMTSAKQHFKTYGYEKTKLKNIAKEVEIGEGTLFNYFPTKQKLLVEVIGEYFQSEIYNIYSNDINSELRAALDHYLKNLDLIDKDLLKVVFSNAFSGSDVYQRMVLLDDGILRELIAHLGIDDETVIRLMKACLISAFISYTMSDMSLAELKENLYQDLIYLIGEK